MKKLLAVDTNSLINRAFYGVKPLTTRDGRNVNAVYGIITMLSKHLDEIKPDFAVCSFDLKSPTFRHQKCDFYKATRKGMPPELAEQFEDAKRACSALGFHEVTCEGFEADDVLGSLSSLATDDLHVYLLTGDRDSYQLVTNNVTVLYLSTKETKPITPDVILDTYGVTPRQLIEVKSLMGDTSDNIPGVKGVGEKTALDLIQKYSSIDGVYSALETNPEQFKASVKDKLCADKENAYTSRFLAEIVLNAPIQKDLESFIYEGKNKNALYEICSRLELTSLISRFNLTQESSDSAPCDVPDAICTDCLSGFDKAFCRFDFQAQKIYVLTHDEKYLCCDLTLENAKTLLCDQNKIITVCDLKSLLLWLYNELGTDKVSLSSFYDIMLASYIADPSSVMTEQKIFELYASTSQDNTNNYLFLNALKNLKQEFETTITEHNQTSLFYDIEMPLCIVLSRMEYAGFLIDAKKLSEYSQKLEASLNQRMQNIYTIAGMEFNINSPKQLGEVLFEKMGLPASKKTKSGYSTDAATLEKLRPLSPIIDEILEYRLVAKLKSTYADGLISQIGPDGRLHTNFKQALTLTGRLSSTEPNLQNIPIRTLEGRQIRSVFVPSQNNILIDADYSQIELRLMAAMSGDENMISTYTKGEDIHTMTASQVFSVCPQDVTPDLRKKAKAVNFGIIYGISDFALAGDIKVTKKQAAEYIKTYFEKYPKIAAYLDNVKKEAYENGYVTTLFGRRRYIPELASRLYMQRMFGERVAMNAPIQGTAADIIKIAMIHVDNKLRQENLDARLILQVHDELIVESSIEHADRAKEILIKEMENAANLAVSLEVSANMGKTWEECHE